VISVSRKYLQQIGTQQVTATASGTTPTSTGSTIVVYTAAGARRAADVRLCVGFYGPGVSALTSGPAGFQYADTVTGTPTIGTADAVLGGNYLECSAAAAAENVQWTNSGILAIAATVQIGRLSFTVGSLPGADLDLFSLPIAGPTISAVFRFRQASGKIGVQIGAGTEQLSDAAITVNSRISVDWRLDVGAATHLLDWQVAYSDGSAPVAQTQASVASSAGTAIGLTVGWTAAQTGTVRYADLVVSTTRGHYPLGDMRIYPLKVDPAGTLTISGTAANFNTFTNNGTMAAWNATTARDAIDDIPPTIGASADGIAAVTAHATDYVEIPLETLDLAAIPGSIRGVRVCVPGWAASGTAATFRLNAYDGTTEHVLYGEADPGWDNAIESWICRMVRPASGRIIWTQAVLDALAVRFGSNDATPDIGIHAVLGEAVVRIAETGTIMGEVGSIETTAGKDPDSAATLNVTVNTPAETGATLRWTDNAVPGSQAVAASSTHTETFLDAIDSTIVTVVEVESGSEFTERE
jgi:hypothetical protein